MLSDAEHQSDTESTTEVDKSEKSTPPNKDTGTKRRTKTGCLTCRKRRIKCGEERPVCKNCIKSKRECAGYNHPLIYKQHAHTLPQPVQGTVPAIDNGWAHGQSSRTLNSFDIHNVPNNQFTYPFLLTSASSLRGMHTVEAVANSYSTIPSPWIQQSGDNFHTSDPEFDGSVNHVLNTAIPVHISATFPQPHPLPLDASLPSLTSTRYSSLGFTQRTLLPNTIQPSLDTVHIGAHSAALADEGDDSDDPWDVDMDDEHEVPSSYHDHPALDHTSHNCTSAPRLSSDENLLQAQSIIPQWRPPVSSPLLDEKSQKIFNHFISITGPCMGTFDRHDSLDGLGLPIMIWTHGLPAMAFDCPPLAHAILAVSAMHMAKLSLLSNENTAVKHFTYALRRVGTALRDSEQRHKVTTLATVLLLGYYEVMAGDHSRWNLHLSGGRRLVMEHNYAGMIQTVRRMRAKAKTNIAQAWTREQMLSRDEEFSGANISPQLFNDNDWNVDQKLISRLMGCEVNYDTQVQPNFQSGNLVPDFTLKSFNDWKILVELYWWYCRQDVFMSMLSGDPLLLPYSKWKYCPPRGPLGNPDSPYTTLDHLWLVIARLTDFGGKDRKRKQKIVNGQGGHWIPPRGFIDPPDSSSDSEQPSSGAKQELVLGPEIQKPARPHANEGRARTFRQGSDQSPPLPMFYGMMPPTGGPIQMPTSFNIMNAELRSGPDMSPIDIESPQSQDLDTQTRHALDEHASITEAFDLFETHLGPDFHPLPAGDIQITTPFGPALRYKNPTIATVRTFYLVGRILLQRLHPNSPPAAMMSAGVNARKTHEYAQTIGRICGGLYAQHSYLLQAGHVDHILSAAVLETTFSLLFAAVQFQDPVQRGWTISKLSEIAQFIGWPTAAAVAAACESAWEKAGLAGRGPPYQRTMDQNNEDARLNGRAKSMNTRSPVASTMSPAEEHESRFVSHDRGLIDKHASTRAHWALGLLSVEEDLQRIALNQDE